MGPRFVQIYGQGETPMVATALARHHLADRTHPRHLERLASVGVAQTPVRIRVADGEGHALPAGEVGEVADGEVLGERALRESLQALAWGKLYSEAALARGEAML